MAETHVATFGYELAGESVNLFLKHEGITTGSIDRKNRDIDRRVSKMEQLEKFLSFVAHRTDESNRLDLTTAEEQTMADGIREHDDLRHLFPEGKYSWKEKELENLTRSISQYVEGPLQRGINMDTEETVITQHELTKALDLFKNGLSRMNNLIERILNNITRSH